MKTRSAKSLVSVSVALLPLGFAIADAAARPARSTVLRWCAADTLHQAELFLDAMRRLGSDGSASQAQMRAELDSIPIVPSADIVLITGEPICQRASTMLDSVFFTEPPSSPVFVVRIGAAMPFIRPENPWGSSDT